MAEALIFDVFGTVVDWRSGVARELDRYFAERHLALDGYRIADAWRGQYQSAMERIRCGERGYVPLDMLHLENLNAVIDQHDLGADIPGKDRPGLARAWEKLPPWPDSVAGLSRLKRRFMIAPCSNGSIALMTRLAKYGGLPWDCVLGAEIAQDYKPQPGVYEKSVVALGLDMSDVIMVAAHNDDLAAAREAGLGTAFIPRAKEHGPGQSTDLRPTLDWDIVASDMIDLADRLGA